MGSGVVDRVVDTRAVGALSDASAHVRSVWSELVALSGGDAPEMGLAAGDRPGADVEVLCSAVAIAEYELARRMALAARSGSLALVGDGAMLLARGWSAGWARRLARAGVFADAYPRLGSVWAAGVITSEHVHAVARRAEALTDQEIAAVLDELAPLWGRLSPHAAGMFLDRVIRMLHPPADPDPDEVGAYESRSLSFALTSDSVVLAGTLPRLEGEAVIAAIDAFAERLRSQADHVPATARRADALVALVNAAHAAGTIPSRGGLPVSVSVTMDTTTTGETVCTTSRGHALTPAEQRFTTCDALITPIVVDTGSGPEPIIDLRDAVGGTQTVLRRGARGDAGQPKAESAARIAAMAKVLFATRIPLAVGRTARTATQAQRRALAIRDGGCIIPGCAIPAEACQTHHVHDWAAGGASDLPNLALLCWAHHRQVDLGMWTLRPVPPDSKTPIPEHGAPPGTSWPANHDAPWIITRTPRTRWRL